MGQRIGLVFVIALVALVAFTVYQNVFSDDAAVRAMAQSAAHDACKDCKPVRIDGKRGVLAETFEFTMTNGASVGVSCRRPYIALGTYACTATKR